MTKSEILFEAVLRERNIKYEKIPVQPKEKIRTPDYKVHLNEIDSYWEIKELVENDNEKNIIKSIGTENQEIYTVNSARVSNSIKSASGQFEEFGVTMHPCVIVLYDNRDFSVKDFMFHQYIQSAMLGTAEYMKNSTDNYIEINRKNGLLTNNKKYISAIALLVESTKELLFFHNPNTDNPLDTNSDLVKFKNHYYAYKEERGLKWKKI